MKLDCVILIHLGEHISGTESDSQKYITGIGTPTKPGGQRLTPILSCGYILSHFYSVLLVSYQNWWLSLNTVDSSS